MSSNALVIYKSSAGSGKTYTLVLEYLCLVLKKPSLYRSVLAITFTNKATEEMKTRITGTLIQLADNRETALQEILAKRSDIPVAEIPARAARVLDKIMHDYSGFAVSTIDSFFSNILRSLARELHLPLRFDLELDTSAVIGEIVNDLLEDTGNDKWLKQWLTKYIFERLDAGESWKIENEIKKLAEDLFKDSFYDRLRGGLPSPDEAFVSKLFNLETSFIKMLAAKGEEFIGILDQNNLSVADMAYGDGGVAGFFNKLKSQVKLKSYHPVRFEQALKDPSVLASKASAKRDAILAIAETELHPIMVATSRLVNSEYPKYLGAIALRKTIYIAGILSKLDEKLRRFRAENDVVLISDTNRMLNEALTGQDAPFLYEKSGNRYTHFMLDEFQDTSDLQWRNLLPLLENALGSGNYVMIVGDAKQSIYRWRGGNMDLLLRGVQSDLAQFSDLVALRNLDSNYRSRENVVSFNNTFFSRVPNLVFSAAGDSIHHDAYHPDEVKQQWKKGLEGEGFVSIRFIDSDDTTGEAPIEQTDSTDENDPVTPKWSELACRESLGTIRNVMEMGFEFRDIAILVRTNDDARVITTYLAENGISRIISPESMQLNQSPAIRFLIDLLGFIDDPSHEIALAHVVYYWRRYLCGDEPEALHQLFSENRTAQLNRLPTEFTGKLSGFRKLPLYEAIEELSVIFRLNQKPEAYFQRFLDLVLEYAAKHPANITDFLEWWDKNQDKDTCSVIIPSAENAIRVMSIHKSKGLQFPVVIVPFAHWRLKPKIGSIIWVSSSIEPFHHAPAYPVKMDGSLENSVFKQDYEQEVRLNRVDTINLLYVAFTRAEEQLYVFSKSLPEKKRTDSAAVPGTVPELIYRTLEDDPVLSSRFDKKTGVFASGLPAPPFRPAFTPDSESHPLTEWHAVSWKQRIRMGISKNKISISDPDTPETRYGLLFHDLVSRITGPVDAEAFVKTNADTRNTEPDMVHRLISDLGMFIRAGEQYGWFRDTKTVVNEAELLLTDGSILRPDRLILEGSKAIVIDYKTGAEEPGHALQIRKYAGVLKQMGYTDTELYLVYTSLNKVTEIEAA